MSLVVLLKVCTPSAHAQAEPPRAIQTLALADAEARAEDLQTARARAQVQAADADVAGARAAWWPEATLDLAYQGRLDAPDDLDSLGTLPPYAPDPTQSLEERVRYLERYAPLAPLALLDPTSSYELLGAHHVYQAGLTVTAALFDGGRRRAAVAAAHARAAAATAQVEAVRERARLDARAAYYQALLADTLLAVATAAADLAEREQADAQRQQAAGLRTEADVVQATSAAASLRARRLQAAAVQRGAYDYLRALLALPVGTPLRLTTALDATAWAALAPEAPGATLAQAHAAQQVAAERQVDAAEAAVRGAQAAWWPTVGLQTNLRAVRAPTSPFDVTGAWDANVTVRVGVQWTLFEGGGRRAAVRAAEAQVADARAQADDLARSLALEQAAVNAAAAQASADYDAQRARTEAARHALAFTRQAHAQGLSTDLDLLRATLDVAEAEAAVAQALVAYLTANTDASD